MAKQVALSPEAVVRKMMQYFKAIPDKEGNTYATVHGVFKKDANGVCFHDAVRRYFQTDNHRDILDPLVTAGKLQIAKLAKGGPLYILPEDRTAKAEKKAEDTAGKALKAMGL